MIRKAKINDAKEINSLINFWARDGRVLERPLNYVYENIRDFWVFESKNKIIACCALSVVGWESLGEVKSLAVSKKDQGKGIGSKLVKKCIIEAKSLGIKNIFALTFVPGFFKKLGFKGIDRRGLPHKIWTDCINCKCFPDCLEEAVMFEIRRRS